MSIKKKRKKPKRKTLNRKLLILWSLIVRLGGKCEKCGTNQKLNAHHHYGKRALSTRWDTNNGICLCAGHHIFSTVFSAHQTPALFVIWINKKRGKAWEERLRKKHRTIVKYSIEDLENLYINLQEEYDKRKNRKRKILQVR